MIFGLLKIIAATWIAAISLGAIPFTAHLYGYSSDDVGILAFMSFCLHCIGVTWWVASHEV
jgi:hypothetical protein